MWFVFYSGNASQNQFSSLVTSLMGWHKKAPDLKALTVLALACPAWGGKWLFLASLAETTVDLLKRWWIINPGVTHMQSFNLAPSLLSWQMTKWQPCPELFPVPLQLSMLVSPKMKTVFEWSESQKYRRLNSLYSVWIHCWIIFNAIPFLFSHPVGKAFFFRGLPLGFDFFCCLDLSMYHSPPSTLPLSLSWVSNIPCRGCSAFYKYLCKIKQEVRVRTSDWCGAECECCSKKWKMLMLLHFLNLF